MLTTRELHVNMEAAGYYLAASKGGNPALEPGMRITIDDWKAEHRCTYAPHNNWTLLIYAQEKGRRRVWLQCKRCRWLQEV